VNLGRGVNLGNAYDTDDWGAAWLREDHLDAVAGAGFHTVRLPVRWSGQCARTAPYTIEPRAFERVDAIVDAALRRGLNVVVDAHHDREVVRSPHEYGERLVVLWHQLAAHYADHPDGLVLELLNEPHDALTAPVWNGLLARALAAVRDHDPHRAVIVGPVDQYGIDALDELVLPDDDRLIATVHYYEPFPFTHQRAPWVDGSAAWAGTMWDDATGAGAVTADLERAARWAERARVALFVGEFGAYDQADPESRVRWTRRVRAEAERLGMSWCYWDFGTDFGAYDLTRDQWREPIRAALLDGRSSWTRAD
jgi:endoglucanase